MWIEIEGILLNTDRFIYIYEEEKSAEYTEPFSLVFEFENTEKNYSIYFKSREERFKFKTKLLKRLNK